MIYFRYLLPIIFLLFSSVPLLAQEQDSTRSADEYYDEEATYDDEGSPSLINPDELPGAATYKEKTIVKRKLSETEWKKVVGDQRFEEKETVPPEHKKQEKKPVESSPWNSNVLRIVSFIILILIVLALSFVILRNIRLDSKVKKTTLLVQEVDEVEDIENLEIESLMDQALKAKNYRMAIRLVYLDLLKALHSSNIIIWKKDKTNFDYLTEIRSEAFAPVVSDITLSYEKVWYGERDASEAAYNAIQQQYHQVSSQIIRQGK